MRINLNLVIQSKRFVKIMVRFVKIWECRSPDQNILYSICEDMGV
jgi:hypothetical protein